MSYESLVNSVYFPAQRAAEFRARGGPAGRSSRSRWAAHLEADIKFVPSSLVLGFVLNSTVLILKDFGFKVEFHILIVDRIRLTGHLTPTALLQVKHTLWGESEDPAVPVDQILLRRFHTVNIWNNAVNNEFINQSKVIVKSKRAGLSESAARRSKSRPLLCIVVLFPRHSSRKEALFLQLVKKHTHVVIYSSDRGPLLLSTSVFRTC